MRNLTPEDLKPELRPESIRFLREELRARVAPRQLPDKQCELLRL